MNNRETIINQIMSQMHLRGNECFTIEDAVDELASKHIELTDEEYWHYSSKWDDILSSND